MNKLAVAASALCYIAGGLVAGYYFNNLGEVEQYAFDAPGVVEFWIGFLLMCLGLVIHVHGAFKVNRSDKDHSEKEREYKQDIKVLKDAVDSDREVINFCREAITNAILDRKPTVTPDPSRVIKKVEDMPYISTADLENPGENVHP